MITIQISELKRFLSNAKSIRDSKIIPILAYVKLDCKKSGSTITKTNLNSFLIYDIEAEFKKEQVILIEEQTLSGAVSFSKGKELKITIVGKNVVLDDGFREIKCQIVEDNFPAVETNSGHNKIQFTTDILSSLSVAKSHVLVSADRSVREWKCFVHVKQILESSFIVGVSGAICYFKSVKEKLPEISLDPETIATISRFSEVEYSSTEKYDYFQCLGITYGFIKTETVCPNLESVVGKLKSDNSFVVNRKDLIDFCEMAININTSHVPPEVSINDDTDGLIMKFTDLSQNQSAVEKIKSEDKTFDVETILFQPRNMLTVLKDIPADKIKVSKIHGNMIFTTEEEKGYIGSVMELVKM